jgi:hypothetical protein
MTKRFALAGALFLTTVLGFTMVTLGSTTGLFGNDTPEGASADTASNGVEATPTSPPATPLIVDEYIYSDEYVSGSSEAHLGESAEPDASPAPLQATPEDDDAGAERDDRDADDKIDDGHGYEHEDHDEDDEDEDDHEDEDEDEDEDESHEVEREEEHEE